MFISFSLYSKTVAADTVWVVLTLHQTDSLKPSEFKSVSAVNTVQYLQSEVFRFLFLMTNTNTLPWGDLFPLTQHMNTQLCDVFKCNLLLQTQAKWCNTTTTSPVILLSGFLELHRELNLPPLPRQREITEVTEQDAQTHCTSVHTFHPHQPIPWDRWVVPQRRRCID